MKLHEYASVGAVVCGYAGWSNVDGEFRRLHCECNVALAEYC